MRAIRPVSALVATVAFVATAAVDAGADAEAPLEWAEGRTAPADLRAPADMVVIDAARTAAALERDGERAPMVARFDPAVADEVVAQFDQVFRHTREAFLTALQDAYGQRQLGSREINASRFRSFRNDFQSANPLLPVNLVLAQTWAKGYDGGGTRDRLAGILRNVLDDHLVANLPPTSDLVIVSIAPGNVVTSWNEAAGGARLADLREVLSLDAAGVELRRQLDALDRAAGGFLSGLLQSNIREDEYLTGLFMRDRLGDRVEARALTKGETIVRRGERIDRWSAVAAEHLNRTGLLVQAGAADVSGVPVEEVAPAVVVQAQGGLKPARWFIWTSAVAVVAGVVACLWWFGRGHSVRPRPSEVCVVAPDATVDRASLRTALLPHLARELKDRLVGALFAQRNALLQNEAAATQRVVELETRLARLQPAIAERIRGYEQRIAELERELALRDQETRELIRAKLVLARQELEAEIARNRIRWN
jgi:hypothetical protein